MKEIDAKKIIRILNWIDEHGEKKPAIESKLNANGLYTCSITLPLINKTVIGLGEHKLESIDNLAKKASTLIDEYEENLKDQEKNDKVDYFIQEDEVGFLTLRIVKKKILS